MKTHYTVKDSSLDISLSSQQRIGIISFKLIHYPQIFLQFNNKV